jgi:hypothetical protein
MTRVRPLFTVPVALLFIVLLSLTAPPADAGKGGNGRGKGPSTSPTAPTSTTVDVLSIHNQKCPAVSEYVTCSALIVTAEDFGQTGWTGSSGPAAGTVKYNTYYTMSTSNWEQTVSHEVGGHHDAWAEVSARGVDPWADYYDLDYFGELWMEARYLDFKGTARDFTRTEGKEMYLDCAGPVRYGYRGNYLYNRSIATAEQPAFCAGHEVVMTDSLTKVRPS